MRVLPRLFLEVIFRFFSRASCKFSLFSRVSFYRAYAFPILSDCTESFYNHEHIISRGNKRGTLDSFDYRLYDEQKVTEKKSSSENTFLLRWLALDSWESADSFNAILQFTLYVVNTRVTYYCEVENLNLLHI